MCWSAANAVEDRNGEGETRECNTGYSACNSNSETRDSRTADVKLSNCNENALCSMSCSPASRWRFFTPSPPLSLRDSMSSRVSSGVNPLTNSISIWFSVESGLRSSCGSFSEGCSISSGILSQKSETCFPSHLANFSTLLPLRSTFALLIGWPSLRFAFTTPSSTLHAHQSAAGASSLSTCDPIFKSHSKEKRHSSLAVLPRARSIISKDSRTSEELMFSINASGKATSPKADCGVDSSKKAPCVATDAFGSLKCRTERSRQPHFSIPPVGPSSLLTPDRIARALSFWSVPRRQIAST